MKRFKIEQSTADIISQSGLALIGQAINRYTTLTQELDTQVPLRHGIKHSDVLKSGSSWKSVQTLILARSDEL